MKIIIVIGQSASGKTTFVKDNYLSPNFIVKTEPIKYTEAGNNICLLGDYGVGRRCVGTDTLPYNALEKIINFVKENYKKYDYLIAEGDRINNKKFFNAVKELNVPVELFVFTCSIAESMERLKKNESTIGETFVKTTRTKANNMKKEAMILGFTVTEINTGKEKDGLDRFFN